MKASATLAVEESGSDGTRVFADMMLSPHPEVRDVISDVDVFVWLVVSF